MFIHLVCIDTVVFCIVDKLNKMCCNTSVTQQCLIIKNKTHLQLDFVLGNEVWNAVTVFPHFLLIPGIHCPLMVQYDSNHRYLFQAIDRTPDLVKFSPLIHFIFGMPHSLS